MAIVSEAPLEGDSYEIVHACVDVVTGMFLRYGQLLDHLKSGVFGGFVVYRKNRLASCDVIASCAFRRAHWLGPCGPWRVYGSPVSSHTYRNNL